MGLESVILLVAVGALGVFIFTNIEKNQKASGVSKTNEKEEYEHKGKYLGTPGFYTAHGHHHCKRGDPDCVCTDPHKCVKGSHYAAVMTDLYGSYNAYARVVSGRKGRRLIDHTVKGRKLSH